MDKVIKNLIERTQARQDIRNDIDQDLLELFLRGSLKLMIFNSKGKKASVDCMERGEDLIKSLWKILSN